MIHEASRPKNSSSQLQASKDNEKTSLNESNQKVKTMLINQGMNVVKKQSKGGQVFLHLSKIQENWTTSNQD